MSISITLLEEKTIWVTSDWHLGHDREFVWGARGFKSVDEMNEAIISRHNELVRPGDDVYVLGDLMLGDSAAGIECARRLNGKLHLVRGNHDTDTRWEMYIEKLPNVTQMQNAIYLKYKKYNFYLSHYPTITSNNDYDKPLKQRLLNLCGHSHTTNRWQDFDKGYIYHCEVDAHDCKPILLDDIIEEMRQKVGKFNE